MHNILNKKDYTLTQKVKANHSSKFSKIKFGNFEGQ